MITPTDRHLVPGQYQCLLQQSVSQDLSQLVSSLEASVEVRAVIPERDGQPEVTSNAISFPFLPAFFLLTPEVQLSNLAGVYNLRVSAGKHVIDDLKVGCVYYQGLLLTSIPCAR